LGCGRRQRAVPAPNVCPISGQASPNGVCPISGQSTPSTASKPGAEAAKKAPPAVQKPALDDPLMGAQSAADAEMAQELKEQGNEKFRSKQYEEALRFYNEAVQLQTKDPGLWLNRSIVNRHLENWEDAEEEAEIACELQPSNPKAFYSRAVAFQHMGKLQRALSCCKKGLSAQADNKALLQLQNLLTRQLAEKQASEDPDRLAKRSSKSTKQVVEEAVDENSCPVSRVNDNEIEGIKQKALNTMYEWKDGNPSRQERDGLKKMLTDAFRGKYEQLRQQAAAAEKSKGTVLQTDQYDKLQKQGLQLKGGHQPMKRPDHVELPPDFKEPMGVISMDTLKKYSYANPGRRYLISVYGNVFDVSDRPDKYGPEGPYTVLTGADITWGLFAGVDTQDYVNRCYDLFKAKDMGKDKIAGVCSWLAWYWTEYGDPVAQLADYQRESDLPAPPLEEVDEACVVM